MHFSLVDILILIIMAWCIASSAMKGFIREILGLATVVIGLIFAAWFHSRLAPTFKDVVTTENLALFAAFAFIFLGTLLIGFVATFIAMKFVKMAKLAWFDRALGAAFGFIRGWVLVSILLLVFTAFEIQSERVKNSLFSPYFLPGSRVMAVITPYDLKARFLVGYRAVEMWWTSQK